MDKAKSSSLSLPESYWERLQKIADTEYGGNRTAAIREMIEAHEALSENHPISDLIARYAPLYKNRYKQALETARAATGQLPDESLLLLNLLEKSIDLVAQGTSDHFTALGAKELRAIILAARDLDSGAELSHFVDKLILYGQSGHQPAAAKKANSNHSN